MRFVLVAIDLTDAGGKFSWKQLERDLQLAADGGASAPAASVASAGAASDEDSGFAYGVHRMRIG